MRLAAIAAAIVGTTALASTASAVITFGVTTQGDLANIYAYTTGDTGTRIVAYELTYNGAPVQFNVTDESGDGTPDTADIAGFQAGTTGTYFRIGTAPQTFVVSTSPSAGPSTPNPYLLPISTYTVTITTTATVLGFDTISTTPGVPNGRQFARLNIPGLQALIASGQNPFVLAGQMQGSAGGIQNVSISIPEPTTLAAVGVAGLGLLARRRKA